MNNYELGERLFHEGHEKLSKFYETAPYSRKGIHSTDYRAIIMRDYFIPSAEYGSPLAMKEREDYYARSNKELALKYYKKYLKACPYDKKTKLLLSVQFGMKLLW